VIPWAVSFFKDRCVSDSFQRFDHRSLFHHYYLDDWGTVIIAIIDWLINASLIDSDVAPIK